MKFISIWYYYASLSGNTAKMFNNNKIIKIINSFDRRIFYPVNYAKKIVFIFCHDDDILSMSLALGLSSAKCVTELFYEGKTDALNCETDGILFSSNLILELHENGGAHFVKVRSSGVYMNMCGKPEKECEYGEFKKQLSEFMAEDYEHLCGEKIRDYDKVLECK